ncbi:MAG: D-alanyl-alanine synthetase A [Acidobacteria bacterium ADurb.Bin051]|nr:MAG: D-alanyl-alanine synthetase A [Acidobacteria bacterium ADurb.Bin051]
MAHVTKRIGLSLGADLCWPICFEELLARLALAIPIGGDTISFAVERVTIEPFDLRQPCPYDVVLDRLTHWYHTSREWIKKAVVMDDLYVLNNPWSLQANEKHTSYCAMMRLGMPVPDTWMLPPKAYEPREDLQVTLERYARLFDLAAVGEKVGYPAFVKPYDGGAWVGVSKVDNELELNAAYDASGTRLLHLQRAVLPFDLFVRALGVGPQVSVMRYDPEAPLHDRYKVDFDFVNAEEWRLLADTCLTINTFFGWDFNSCEALRRDGVFHPIDFANACPDSQVTSLHYHFPWLVKAKLRWALFVAATGRRMRKTLDWEPYFAVAREELPYREKLARYAAIARERLEADRFEEFCARHLAHLDEVAWEFFGTEVAREAVRAKVAALYPAHEVERFTEHFWGLIQFWRRTEADRLGTGS